MDILEIDPLFLIFFVIVLVFVTALSTYICVSLIYKYKKIKKIIQKNTKDDKHRHVVKPSRQRWSSDPFENDTYSVLYDLNALTHCLKNVYVPFKNGGTTEIDYVIIRHSGIIVIESKDVFGSIYGDEDDEEWTKVENEMVAHTFYNPIKQNNGHIKALKNELKIPDFIPIYSIILFSDRSKFVDVQSRTTTVIHLNQMYSVFGDIDSNTPNSIPQGLIEELYRTMRPLTDPPEYVKQEHIRRIQEKYGEY